MGSLSMIEWIGLVAWGILGLILLFKIGLALAGLYRVDWSREMDFYALLLLLYSSGWATILAWRAARPTRAQAHG